MLFKKSASLKKVYYGSFLALIVIPITVVFLVSISVLRIMMFDSAITNVKSAQDSMMSMLEEDVNQSSLQLAHFVYVNSGELIELAAETDTDEQIERNRQIRKLEEAFQVAIAPEQDIILGQFYMKDGRVTSVKDDVSIPMNEIKSSEWYQSALEKKDVVSVGTYDTGRMSPTYSRQRKWEFIIVAALAPDITVDRTGKVEMVTLFYRSGIAALIRDYERDKRIGHTAILDGEGNVIYQGHASEDAAWYIDQLGIREKGVYTQKVKNYEDSGESTEKYTFVVSSIPVIGWKIVNYMPANMLTEDFSRLAIVMLSVILVLFILFYCFSWYFLKNILNPVHRVIEGMEGVQGGNLDFHIEPEGQSEIRKMVHSFNRMVRILKSSIEETRRAEEMKHEAEIKALQSQINPHFLVNALNSIRFMAQVSKFDGIRKMAEALIKIVSCSFRSNISFYTLREEVEVLDSYLYLMKIRYSDGFETEYQIEQECLNCLVPRLILQPLVENSVVHGFNGEDMGLLKISARQENGKLILSVWDNGTGMSEEEIQEIYRGKVRSRDDNSSIGLENVIARLKLNYGGDCEIFIDSTVGQYTEIMLKMPIEEKCNEEKSIDRR